MQYKGRLVVGWVWRLILLELLPCVAGANTQGVFGGLLVREEKG